ncbi:MAG: hypothetical protein RMY64_13450 [Nostoc sp. DedQUE08]|uniref:hypothetical protein n=2 Tax=unclassified Nostoc TaxID=2593658 RepID=UPI002AD28337|nr:MULTISPECIES: hypothetical protein [unclassified Nostoc]MDZ8035953.1 hypothetical protein [Nostoc sp. DedSLP04]MDZ8066604.1 hypothetical protein [Nostoc sp. DedQUE08]MDZ8132305.1 hypothetical protein [Nostoc sp. DedQUE07]
MKEAKGRGILFYSSFKTRVGINIMHEVSKQTIKTAQKHAQKAIEHSKEIQELGKSLETDDQIDPEQKERIEAYGKTMHEHAQKFQDLAHRLIEDPSTDVYSEAVEEHTKVNQAHIEAIKELQKIQPPA